jgi:membrane protease YdiL (CAAX protease family)
MNNPSRSTSREILWFVVITFAFSWLLNLPRVLETAGIFQLPGPTGFILGTLAVFGPAVAAFSLMKKQHGKSGFSMLFKRAWDFHFPKIWLLPALFLIPLTGLLSWLILMVLKQPIEWQYGQTLGIFPIVLVIIFLLNALPEEYGWRGYALDRFLAKWNPLAAALILGAIWGLWHLPLHFIEGTTQYSIPVVEFFLQTVLLSIFYTWIYVKSNRSLFLMVLLHTTANLTGAYLPNWTTTVGRLTMFIIQLLVALIILFQWKPWIKKEEAEI